MSLFSWGRGDDGAPAPAAAGPPPAPGAGPADAAQRPRPAPLDLPGAPVDDAAKWAASRARWNLAITPDSPEFVQQKAVFEAALDPGSGRSIEDTLKEHFSNYEVYKFSGWADRTREPDLHAQQRRDAEAYNTLLTRPPWDREAPQAFLAFKMTMLYFGFSVEPMRMNDLFRLPPGSGLFGLDDDTDADLDDQRTFIPEEMRPLRFLNRYDKRSYGADNGHMMPDPTFEMYYGLPFQPPEGQQHGHGGPAAGVQADMRIRGRGLGEDRDEDEDEDADIEDDLMSDASVDGASFCSDSLLPDAPDAEVDGEGGRGRALNLRGGAGGSFSGGQAVVYSFSGCAGCNVDFARGFYAAVDTALALGSRLGVHITVALIRVVPNQWAELIQLERGTLGDVTSETDLYDRLLYAHTRERREDKGTLAFFVCHAAKDEPLRELQNNGQGAMTIGVPYRDAEVFQFPKSGSSGTHASAAYLWMPPAVTAHTASNHYTEWFRTVVRIASGPHDLTDRLGRPSAQLPRAPRAVQVGDILPPFHYESPLPRKVWETMVGRGRQGGTDIKFHLSFTSLEGQAFAQVPGYYPDGPATATSLDTEAVFRLAWDSVPAYDRNSVARMVIRRPGDMATATFECKNGSVDRTTVNYAGAQKRLRDWLTRKYFFNIVPQWDEYDVTIPTRSGGQSTLKLTGASEWSRARSDLLAAVNSAGWNVGDQHVGHVVLRIDQRTAAGQGAADILQKNRVAWDMEIGTGRRDKALWREFKAALSVKRLLISPQPKRDSHNNPTTADPLAYDGQGLIWSRWGCNRRSVNEDTGEPAGGSTPRTQTHTHTQTQAQDLPHGGHHQNGNARDERPGQGQGQGQGILHQGVPQLGAGVDIFQSGKYYREQSFATPLSVQVGDQKPRFPINAPPLEHIRRPRGADGIESDSMPVVSTQVMTPTEQRTLQQAFFQMRSIALNRAQQCPHKDCTAFFPVGPGGMAAFHTHLDAKHVGTHCPFCDETLFKHWSATDRQKHFVDRHSEYFTTKGDLLREALLADRTKSMGNVDRREEQYSFCPRCGRDHQLLSSKADRVHHDNACFPGNEATVPTEKYCRRCGEPDHVRASSASGGQRQPHRCAAEGTDPAHPAPASNVFCNNCALECHQLPASYGRRHLLNCKPLASKPDNWCPWCGIDLKSGPRSVRLKHLAVCALKPASGQNPVCTDSGLPLESPRDRGARRLKYGLLDLGTINRKTRIDVPPVCPVKGCQADLTSWNAQGLYYHFQSHPENVLEEGGGLKGCPFCKCDFGMRGFHTSWEKQKHLEDHIQQRRRRVLSDEIIGSNPDRESPVVLGAFSTLDHDEFDQKAEIDHLHIENNQLSESIKRLAAENRKLRDAQSQSHIKDLKTPKPSPSPDAEPRRAARASRLGPGKAAPSSKRKDGTSQDMDMADRPAKKSRVVHHGPSTATVPGFSIGGQALKSVPDAGEDWGEEDDEDEDELALGSEVDVGEGIIDDDDDDFEEDDDDNDEDFEDDDDDDDDQDELAD